MNEKKSLNLELLREENFRALVNSYAILFTEDSAELMIEKALRGHAKEFGGCVSCAFSRFLEPKAKKDEDYRQYLQEIWLSRLCVLGLKQDTCCEHLKFPLQEEA